MKKSKKKGKEALDEALLKVAVGYSVEEVTEEYAEVDGEMKLMKRKETKKDIPPDLKAVQILLADSDTDFSKMSDEDLERERDRLLAELEFKKERGDCLAKTEKSDLKNCAENPVQSKSVGDNFAKSKSVKSKTGVGKVKKKAGKSTAKKISKKV